MDHKQKSDQKTTKNTPKKPLNKSKPHSIRLEPSTLTPPTSNLTSLDHISFSHPHFSRSGVFAPREPLDPHTATHCLRADAFECPLVALKRLNLNAEVKGWRLKPSEAFRVLICTAVLLSRSGICTLDGASGVPSPAVVLIGFACGVGNLFGVVGLRGSVCGGCVWKYRCVGMWRV